MEKEIKKCETCGKMKTKSEMSKSYKHRCKACVAEMVRSKRADLQNSCNKKCIDWEQRRYEIAKDIVANSFSTPMENVSMVSYIHDCVQVADMLIEELKRK